MHRLAVTVAIALFSLNFGLSSFGANGSGAPTGPTPTNPTSPTSPTSPTNPNPPTNPTSPTPSFDNCVNSSAQAIQAAVTTTNGVATAYSQAGIDGSIAAAGSFCNSFFSVSLGYTYTITSNFLNCVNLSAKAIMSPVTAVPTSAGLTPPSGGTAPITPVTQSGALAVDGAIAAAGQFCSSDASSAANYTTAIPTSLVICINSVATQIDQTVTTSGGVALGGQAGINGSILAASNLCSSLQNPLTNNMTIPANMLTCINTAALAMANVADNSGGVGTTYRQTAIDGSIALAGQFCALPVNEANNFAATLTSPEMACLNTAALQVAAKVKTSGGFASASKYSQFGANGSLETAPTSTCLNNVTAPLQPAVAAFFTNGTLSITPGKQLNFNNSFGSTTTNSQTSSLMPGPAGINVFAGQYGMIEILQITASELAVSPANMNVTWISVPNQITTTASFTASVSAPGPSNPIIMSGTTTTVLINTFQGTEPESCTSPSCTDMNGSPIPACSATQEVTGTFNTMQYTLNMSFYDNGGSGGAQELLGSFAGIPQQYYSLVAGTETNAGTCVPTGDEVANGCGDDASCPSGSYCNQTGICVLP
jgi:hypothetical protein